jgi:hypothetical protein
MIGKITFFRNRKKMLPQDVLGGDMPGEGDLIRAAGKTKISDLPRMKGGCRMEKKSRWCLR